jgi:hypothetical protein
MATEAAWLECKESTGRKEKTEKANRKRKTHLTHTGLLMEGVGRRYLSFYQLLALGLEKFGNSWAENRNNINEEDD